MGRKIVKHPVEGGTCKRGHPVLFHHEVDDLLPTVPGQALLGDEAFGVADDAIGVGFRRTITRHEDAKVRRIRLACRRRSRLSRILAGSHADRNDKYDKRGDNNTPNRPGNGTHPWPSRPDPGTLRPLRLHQPTTPAHETRRATRCIVLFRYPLGFQSIAWGCIIPVPSVARAQIS